MKYKIGDKVRIRRDLVVDKSYAKDPHDFCTYIKDMKDVAEKNNYILTIEDTYFREDRYIMLEDEEDYSWTDEMIEGLVEEKSIDREKFEAFLKEVVDGTKDCDENYEAWSKIHDLTNGKCFSKKEVIQWLTDFYYNFVPKDENIKKMTKAEIEAELGYKIEIVEE
jgi:hypothetical protein